MSPEFNENDYDKIEIIVNFYTDRHCATAVHGVNGRQCFSVT